MDVIEEHEGIQPGECEMGAVRDRYRHRCSRPLCGSPEAGRKISVDGVAIPVISIDDLIKMKRAAGREVDKADIQYLTVS